MSAAARFVKELAAAGRLVDVVGVKAELFGSLALTGKGHATDRAVMLGLEGLEPADIDPDAADRRLARIRETGTLALADAKRVVFDEARDLLFLQKKRLPFHSNGMRFVVLGEGGAELASAVFYSVGGGAIVAEHEVAGNAPPQSLGDIPHPFRSGADLLSRAATAGQTIAALMRENELAARSESELVEGLAAVRAAMSACIDRGIRQGGILPGGLRVKRRAPDIHAKLLARAERAHSDPLGVIDWLNLWALAVNEENAAGGKVVTAPTNGAAGIVPAVLRYYERCVPGADVAGEETFLLTAAAIGSLFKANASISGAEVGCQGEVGVACSMAAAGLTAALGGTNMQIENAAEIGMEHNLGLTCDPVAGLVQVPCIERNAVGAIKAIEAARLALLGDGVHRVSLDEVIETMRRTGADMSRKYKETALGGLAVNVVEC
jgi:L-serine dehydratase